MTDAAPRPPFRTRTDVLFAARSAVAVVLRRGPRKHYQLLLWDTAADTFMPGQWMKGVISLCDLSPDGRKLIYFAAQEHASAPWRRARTRRFGNDRDGDDDGDDLIADAFDPIAAATAFLREFKKRHPKRKPPRYLGGQRSITGSYHAPAVGSRLNTGTWTAVSTPPYFSALAIWPSNGRWTGGGFFRNEATLVINEPPDAIRPIANVRFPSRIKLESTVDSHHTTSPPTLSGSPRLTTMDVYDRVSTSLRADGARFVDWIYPAPDGDLLFACDGSIFRRRNWQASVSEPGLLAAATRVVDLTGHRFELIAPPREAMRW